MAFMRHPHLYLWPLTTKVFYTTYQREAIKKSAALIWTYSKTGLTPPLPPRFVELLGDFLKKFHFDKKTICIYVRVQATLMEEIEIKAAFFFIRVSHS